MAFHSVKYYFKHNLIPIDYVYLVPLECECGYDTEANEEFTTLRCSNPICPLHMSQKMDAIFKLPIINARNLGPSNCREIIEENHLVHPAQVFLLSVDQMPSKNKEEVRQSYYNEIHKSDNLTLAEVARLLKAPDMQGRCDDIFRGYSDIDKFYKDFNYDEAFISKQLGIKPGVLTERFTAQLTSQELILRGLCKVFHVRKVSEETLTVCMTGALSSVTREDGTAYSTRELFLKDVQKAYSSDINIISKSGVSANLDLLVTDTPYSHSIKNNKAEKYGISKLTFADFKALLEFCHSLTNKPTASNLVQLVGQYYKNPKMPFVDYLNKIKTILESKEDK